MSTINSTWTTRNIAVTLSYVTGQAELAKSSSQSFQVKRNQQLPHTFRHFKISAGTP